jgi:hypothetical protein
MMADDKTKECLRIIKSAISTYRGDKGPGIWKAEARRVYFYERPTLPALVYVYRLPEQRSVGKATSLCLMPGPEWGDINDPWEKWGGSSIILDIEASGKLMRTGGTVESGKTYYKDITIFMPLCIRTNEKTT